MTERLLVGTRRSALARSQTDLVIRALARRSHEVRFEAREITTSGDRDLGPGASPDFTDAIDRALLRGEVDLAVHSAKDLPLELPEGLTLAALPRREDPRDCLIVRRAEDAFGLPRGARVGSSSLRRRAQLLRWRPDLELVEMRGNVDSRLRRVRAGEVDAAVVALAGVRRLGNEDAVGRVLPTREFLPAPAQGALAVAARTDDRASRTIAAAIDHPAAHAEVSAERAFASTLGGDCHVPLAALARVTGRRLRLVGEVLSPDGKLRLRAGCSGPRGGAARVGAQLARNLIDRGGKSLLVPLRR